MSVGSLDMRLERVLACRFLALFFLPKLETSRSSLELVSMTTCKQRVFFSFEFNCDDLNKDRFGMQFFALEVKVYSVFQIFFKVFFLSIKSRSRS